MSNKLCLGTVQFGMKYGINNKKGQPSKKEVFKMIDIAIDKGIDVFDTANAYGNAETLLGDYIMDRDLHNNIKIISKLCPNLIENDDKKAQYTVEEEVIKSIKKLNVDTLEGYLLHTPDNLYNNNIMEGLHICKKKGYVKNIGISIYETKHAIDAVSSGIIDYIQIPYSIFDQRIDNTNFFNIAHDNDVKIFARSAFLQGLILMDDREIPNNLNLVKGYLKTFDNIINKYGFNRMEVALNFVLSHIGIDYLVFGVDSPDQLIEDINISKSIHIPEECIRDIKQNFKNIEKSIIFPSLWAKHGK